MNVELGKNPLLDWCWRTVAGDFHRAEALALYFLVGLVNRFGYTETKARAADDAELACLAGGAL